jgi:hypothetical protein
LNIDFERSLAIWPVRNWLPHLYLGVVAAIEGDERFAIKHRNDAYRLVSSDADGLLSIAWFDLMNPRTKPAKSKARRNRLGKSSFLTDSCISVKSEDSGSLSFHESVFEISEITGRS